MHWPPHNYCPPQSAGKVLLEMTVEIGDGRSDTIRIRKKSGASAHHLPTLTVRRPLCWPTGTRLRESPRTARVDPHDLAVEFVRKNGLGESVIEALAGHIRSHMIALPSSKSTSGRHGDASRDPKAKVKFTAAATPARAAAATLSAAR